MCLLWKAALGIAEKSRKKYYDEVFVKDLNLVKLHKLFENLPKIFY